MNAATACPTAIPGILSNGGRVPLLLAAIAAVAMTAGALRAQDCTGTETWIPVDAPGRPYVSSLSSQPDGLYAILSTVGVPTLTSTIGVARFDGTTWSEVAPIGPLSLLTTGLARFNGEWHLSEVSADDPLQPGIWFGSIARWNGTAWIRLPKPCGSTELCLRIGSMLTGADGLYCSYLSSESTSGAKRYATGIARWDGSAWTTIHRVGNPGGAGIAQFALSLHNGKFHAFGPFEASPEVNEDTTLTTLSVLEGDSLRVLAERIHGRAYRQCSAGTVLYALIYMPDVNAVSMVKWDGTRLETMALPASTRSLTCLGAFRAQPYVFGFTTDSRTVTARFDGATWQRSAPATLVAESAEYAGNLYVAGGWNGSLTGPPRTLLSGCLPVPANIARLCDAGECPMITGRVFVDADGDCIPAFEEQGPAGRALRVEPLGYVVRTDADGAYGITVPRGVYSVRLVPQRNWPVHCPDDGTIAIDVSNGVSSTDRNFALTRTTNVRDGRVMLSAGRARPGMPLSTTITIGNAGTATLAEGRLRLRSLPLLAAGALSFTPTSSTPGAVTWAARALLPDITPDHSWDLPTRFNADLIVPPTARAGDTILLIADYDIDGNADDDMRDNHDTLRVPVISSIGANEIVAAPAGVEPDGTIQPSDSVLTYTIHFRNMGDDTARTVMIVDTLPPALDGASVTMLGASHSCAFRQTGNGRLEWTFDAVMLPDSRTDAARSEGHVSFRARLRPGLAPGTRIPNRAAVYFDLNAPVITNTALNTIASASEVEPAGVRSFTVAPNPARDRATVRFEGAASVELHTMFGQRLRCVDGTAEATLDLSDLPEGSYVLTVTARDGNRSVVRLVHMW